MDPYTRGLMWGSIIGAVIGLAAGLVLALLFECGRRADDDARNLARRQLRQRQAR